MEDSYNDYDDSEEKELFLDDWGDEDDEWEQNTNENEDEDEAKIEMELNKCRPQFERNASYLIMDMQSIENNQRRSVQTISSALQLTFTESASLLLFYQFDTNKLLTEWSENENKVRLKVGISKNEIQIFKPDEEFECSSCYDDVKKKDGFCLNCNHWYCNDCWKHYIQVSFQEGKGSIFTPCMNNDGKSKCNEVVPEDIFLNYLNEKQKFTYRSWVLENYVDGNPNIKWCPNPRCQKAVYYKNGIPRKIICGYMFCFACVRENHRPCPCDLVHSWLNKLSNTQNLNEEFINSLCKNCPKCNVPIMKDKHCNHMQCSQCHHHFCWLCKNSWAGHNDYYKCSTFNSLLNKGGDTEYKNRISKHKTLQKFVYFQTRFEHQQHEIEKIRKFNRQVTTHPNFTNFKDFNAFNFLIDAGTVCLECSSALQWTYALSYYLHHGPKKNSFIYFQSLIQNKLKSLVNTLLLDEDVDRFFQEKNHIINLTVLLRQKHQDLCDSVDNDMDFEMYLMKEPDQEMDAWGCTSCTTENSLTEKFCTKCKACQPHGEIDCRICVKNY